MGFVFDGATKTISITPGTTSFDALDLYNKWKEWAAQSDNLKWAQAMYSTGGDPLGGGKQIAGYIIMLNGWVCKPYDGNYTLIISGNLVGEGGIFPFIPADAGSVNISLQVTSNALAVIQATGSGLSTEEHNKLMGLPQPENIWSYERV